jgi:hypothetical protein
MILIENPPFPATNLPRQPASECNLKPCSLSKYLIKTDRNVLKMQTGEIDLELIAAD